MFKEKQGSSKSTLNAAKWRWQQQIIQNTVDASKTSIDRSTSEKKT